MANNRLTHDFRSPANSLSGIPYRVSALCFRKTSTTLNRIGSAFRPLLNKLTAASLVFSLTCFSSVPLAFAQQSLPAESPVGANVPSQGAPDRKAGPSLPLPSTQASLKARDLFRKGTEALKAQKSKRAMKLFAAAHRLDPANGSYVVALEVARQQQVSGLVETAKTDEQQGQSTRAKQQLEAAMSIDPHNPLVEEHVESLATEEEPAVVQSMPMPQFSTGLIELAPTTNRATFHLQENAQQIVHQVFLAYGITALLDDSVAAKAVRFDVANATFSEASTALQLATDTFIVPLDADHVVVAKDSKENRMKFERLLLETVYIPGQDPKAMQEAVNLIKTVFDVRQVSLHATTGAMSIRAPEATLRAINATLARLYLDRPEVILDVRVYQLNDSRMQDLGVAFPQSLDIFNASSELASIISSNASTVSELISSGLVNPGDLEGIAALLVGLGLVNGTVFNQPFALFGNGLTLSGLSFGSTTVNASLNISNTRELDHIQLRASDMEKQSFLVGSKFPVVTQSYSAGTQNPTGISSVASLVAGVSAATASTVNPLSFAPSVQYEDLGLTVTAQPHVLQGNNVQMKLQVKIASLSGQSLNASPIINNQSFTTTVQVHDGGNALITSMVSQTESKALTGIPGLSELPGFQWTASPSTQLTVGKLLIVISPHIVSATHSSVASQMLPLPPHAGAQ